jgi:peptidoglycan/LPS O-acetylase OafA/YrhL
VTADTLVRPVRAPPRGETTRPWFVGLDGLRAVAVTAVVVFHFAPTALPGGFLGVDLFFVISGYLITRMLLAEVDATRRIAVRDFYLRRIRRLLPAVIVLIVVTATASALVWRDELPTMRGSMLASLGYVTNWWLISDHQSYFVASGRPPMLQHLWSLAIEEQFYLVWPLALVLITRAHLAWRRRDDGSPAVLAAGRLYRVAVVATALALGSTLVMSLIAIRSDVPYGADSGRVYFGTDTHAMGLLLGAAAGALATRGAVPLARGRPVLRGAFLTDAAAVLALGGLIQIVISVDEFTPWLYRGGFLVVSLLCVVVVAAVPRRLSLLGWLLDRKPLRWVGTRSYSIYLWHWPVAVVTRPNVDLGLAGWQVFGLRTAVTLGLAEASYRLIERPFRAGGLRMLSSAWAWLRLAGTSRRSMATIVLAGMLVVAGSLISVLAYETPRRAVAAAPSPAPSTTSVTRSHPASPNPTAERRTPHPVPSRTPHPAPPGPAHPTRAKPAPLTVSAFGDSVMLGASPELAAAIPHATVSAVEGRQARDVFADIADRRQSGTLAPNVVIHAGDNGIISPDDLSSVLVSLGNRRRVVLVTDRVARDWQGPNNDILRSMAGRFRNVVLVDWYAISNRHKDWFYNDGLHLRPPGAQAYAAAVAAALKG